MNRNCLVFCVLVCSCFVVHIASAAGGGGGGAGANLGSGGGGGRGLNKVFQEGTALLSSGECEEAEKKFRTVLKAVPKNPEASYLRGAALACLGKHKEAARWFGKAIRYDRKMYPAYEKLGRSHLVLGQREDAEKQLGKLKSLLKKCGSKCPANLREAYSDLAAALLAVEEQNTGTDTGTEKVPGDANGEGQHGLLFDRVPDPNASYRGAVELIHSERFEDAIDSLRRLASAIGPHPDVLNYLGYAYRRLERYEQAETYYEQALTIDPLHRGANEYLGEMYVELGRLDEARARLAVLDEACPFACAEYEDLERVLEQRVVAAQ